MKKEMEGLTMVWFLCLVLFILLIILDYQIGRYLYTRYNNSQHYAASIDKVEVYAQGEELFRAMKDDIKKAKQSIDMQFFTIRNDKMSNEIYQLLIEKQLEGIRVRLLTDWAGSIKFRSKWLQQKLQMKKTNIPRLPFFYHMQQRNHRKVLVIDQCISYMGGFNLGDEYIGKDPQLGKWRDYHLRMTGTISNVLQDCFDNDWGEVSKVTTSGDVKVLSTEGHMLEEELLPYIKEAKQSIEIGSPYFVPTKRLDEALEDALNRGVKVTILYPAKTDHLIAKAAALPYLKKMKEAGATIYLYHNGFFHGKVFFFDQKICDVGTANFDRRSMQLNQELNLLVTNDHPMYQKLRKTFDIDLRDSHEMSLKWVKHQPMHMKLLSVVSIFFRGLI
ncbi:phospholipase D-like domain-containing protein [Gracilibacillus sp. S3-1-1]|uniref:Phospholipase D-like domain-containing protein n=1 Tax=Gracilibacillus pellucidus TaxID=3095368 RepID=A0ACC6M2D2_9BACI|nr:phospholipase D-like domain-containing protein [Gracilibacillus sp. S3-1-1]MDX8045035.1 phospholipase D-like domain-containing protein [Gracilibacillus sp. S3-1-1]